MRLAKYKEQLRENSMEELKNMLEEERKNLFICMKDSATKQLENTSRIKHAKKNIARILTIMREREFAGEAK